jgi:molecular chaperone DnaK (HSP70)
MSGSGWSLGIDFGTSFTTGAMAVGDGPPVLVEVDHSWYMPSVVLVDRDGQLLAGKKAKQQAVVFPERAVRVPKRALVAGPSVILGDAAVPVTRLVGAVLARIRRTPWPGRRSCSRTTALAGDCRSQAGGSERNRDSRYSRTGRAWR